MGRSLGSFTGVPGGGLFGEELGKRVAKLMGSGDYEVNTSVNSLFRMDALPSASFGEDSSTVRIRRREFISDVLAPSTPGTFTNYAYPLNAGMRATFPYLSQIAANYEEFCFDGLVFEFISSASPYITSSSLGTVIASMEYNASSPPFANKYTMENSAFAISTRLDKNLMYGVECAKGSNAQNCYYIRQGASSLPLTTTDLGTFQLALAPSASVPASAVLGELWVTYDVVVKRPVLSPSRFGYAHYFGTGASSASPLGTTALSMVNSGALTLTQTSNNSLAWSGAVVNDVFYLVYYIVGSVTGAGGYTAPTFTITGATATASFVPDPLSAYPPTVNNRVASQTTGGTIRAAITTGMFTATATSGTLTINAQTNPPTGNVACELIVMNMGNNSIPSNW